MLTFGLDWSWNIGYCKWRDGWLQKLRRRIVLGCLLLCPVVVSSIVLVSLEVTTLISIKVSLSVTTPSKSELTFLTIPWWSSVVPSTSSASKSSSTSSSSLMISVFPGSPFPIVSKITIATPMVIELTVSSLEESTTSPIETSLIVVVVLSFSWFPIATISSALLWFVLIVSVLVSVASSSSWRLFCFLLGWIPCARFFRLESVFVLLLFVLSSSSAWGRFYRLFINLLTPIAFIKFLSLLLFRFRLFLTPRLSSLDFNGFWLLFFIIVPGRIIDLFGFLLWLSFLFLGLWNLFFLDFFLFILLRFFLILNLFLHYSSASTSSLFLFNLFYFLSLLIILSVSSTASSTPSWRWLFWFLFFLFLFLNWSTTIASIASSITPYISLLILKVFVLKIL